MGYHLTSAELLFYFFPIILEKKKTMTEEVKAHCPHCGEKSNYARVEQEWDNDYVIVRCECRKCGCTFREEFSLTKIYED